MMTNIRIKEEKLLSDFHHKLKKVTYEYTDNHSQTHTLSREIYETSNGAAILLYNKEKRTVVLTRQFRLPAFLHDGDGFIIETCAGELDKDDPEKAVIRETEEETGYQLNTVQKVFEVIMMPGTVMEILHCYVASYTNEMKTGKGGGKQSEHENINVLKMDFEQAYNMIGTGEIKDGKTIMLLQYAKLHSLI